MANVITPYRLSDQLIPLRGAVITPPPDPTVPPGGAITIAAAIASANDGNVPANAIDNDLSTRWSAQGAGQWIRFDLGDVYTVASVDIAWHLGDQRRTRFEVQVSDDGVAWTQVYIASSSGATLRPEPVNFPDVAARYVRIVGYGNSQNNWNSITEVEVIGGPDNVAAAPNVGVATAAAGDGRVRLGGSVADGPTPTSHRWQRATASGGPYANLTGTTLELDDTQVANGTTYYYRRGDVNADGTTWTAEVSATPLATGGLNTTMADIDGLGATRQEWQMWRQRAGVVTSSHPSYVSAYGGVKYRSWHDVSPNSPNDWERIKSEANSFSTTGIWNGTMSESAVNETNANRATSAAFRARIENDSTLGGRVVAYLNNQANAVDLSAKPRTSSGTTQIDTHPMMDISPKLFCDQMAWSWVERYASSAQRTNILNYLDEAGDWLHALVSDQLGSRFENYASRTNHALKSEWRRKAGGSSTYPDDDRRLWYGGPHENRIAINRLNNRFGASIGFLAANGMYFNNAPRKHDAWKWATAFILYAIYVDGAVADMYRTFEAAGYDEAGMRYATGNHAFADVTAMLLARGYRGGPNGDSAPDRSLYDLVTTNGLNNSAGAPSGIWSHLPGKSLRFGWLALGGYPQELYSPVRWGGDGKSYIKFDPLDGKVANASSGTRYVNHTYAVYANLYYRDPEIDKLILFTGAKQLNGYPSNSTVMPSGSSSPWRGSQRNWPGHMFMYAQSPIFPFPVA